MTEIIADIGKSIEAPISNTGIGGINSLIIHVTAKDAIGIHHVVKKHAQMKRTYVRKPPIPVTKLR